jgi:2-amino-4-hydroxy-6-hydroxymethyldihydropteridine diphosphokinase
VVTALLGLGSNLGDREQNLRGALADIEALPDARVSRVSKFHVSKPIGGPPGQKDFLNSAARVETSHSPLRLLDELKDIETRRGRKQTDRWAPRPIDIDILLFGDEVAETAMLTLPHPRMSFRRFVLVPAAEIAPRMLHPVIGWPVERLLLHLNAASDQVAIVSQSEPLRRSVSQFLAERYATRSIDRPSFATAEKLWPAALSTWVAVDPTVAGEMSAPPKSGGLIYAAAAFPKLTILLDGEADAPGANKSQWSSVARQPGRGPTLRLQQTDVETVRTEVAAAMDAVWG